IAYIYGIMHPESIHRSVMIGVNPPGGFIWDPEKTDGIIKYYSNLWAKDSVMSKRCPDLAAAMQKVLKNMPDNWLFFSIDPDKVKLATFGMLFHRNTAALVFDSYAAAEQGDYSGLALMSFAFNYAMPEQVWGDCFAKAVSADLYYWEKNNFTNEPEILGSPFNYLYWKSIDYGHFPIEMIPDSLRVPVKSDVETLLLSGSVDVTNPPQCAAELLSYLKNGKQIIMSEAGHVGDIRYLQLDATKGLIADYINKGIVDTSKIKYVPMNFEVGWGLTGIAKAALYTVTAVVLLLAAGILWWAI
ncbi:MAG TPA: alpha/beta hydrolase, partial [Ignavibacteriaceae bacterium]|nr:alpha/beta hydrolase [Ignavibacteriaceae bacterium]